MQMLLWSVTTSVLVLLLSACSFNSTFYYPDNIMHKVDVPPDITCEEVPIVSTDGNRIFGLFLKPRNDSLRASILLLHGNGGNVTTWWPHALPLARSGFQVLLLDYQGYGISEGEPTHEAVLDDAEYALEYLRKRKDTQNTRLIVMGISLGGHLAIVVTGRHQDKIDALVVEGAFTSHNDIATHFTPWYGAWFTRLAVWTPYSAVDVVHRLTIPKLIIHSRDDETIPFEMGLALFDRAGEPKDFWQISGAHTDGILLYQKEYIERIYRLIAQ